MSDSVQPQRRQPTRFPRPWDSPGKNTGVGCHFLLQCMKVKSESEVAQSCPTLSGPMDCSLPASSVHGIFQARVLEWGAIALTLFLLYVICFMLYVIYVILLSMPDCRRLQNGLGQWGIYMGETCTRQRQRVGPRTGTSYNDHSSLRKRNRSF